MMWSLKQLLQLYCAQYSALDWQLEFIQTLAMSLPEGHFLLGC